MDIELTAHALRRMALRDITEDAIVAAIEQPRFVSAGRTPGTLAYDAVIDGRGLRVVVVEGSTPLRIVAVMPRRMPRAPRV